MQKISKKERLKIWHKDLDDAYFFTKGKRCYYKNSEKFSYAEKTKIIKDWQEILEPEYGFNKTSFKECRAFAEFSKIIGPLLLYSIFDFHGGKYTVDVGITNLLYKHKIEMREFQDHIYCKLPEHENYHYKSAINSAVAEAPILFGSLKMNDIKSLWQDELGSEYVRYKQKALTMFWPLISAWAGLGFKDQDSLDGLRDLEVDEKLNEWKQFYIDAVQDPEKLRADVRESALHLQRRNKHIKMYNIIDSPYQEELFKDK